LTTFFLLNDTSLCSSQRQEEKDRAGTDFGVTHRVLRRFFYGKTLHHGFRACSAWQDRDFGVVLPLLVLRTHFGQSLRLLSTPCRSTLADVRVVEVFTTRNRRTSPTATRTLTARRTLTTSETVARRGARVHFDQT
jgi:hypothetical protein